MKNKISEADMTRLIESSLGSKLRAIVSQRVSEKFKSAHYLSSKLICDCVVLNLTLNDSITLDSADEIITTVHRSNRSFYTTVESAFFPIECAFTEYAKEILGDGYEHALENSLRLTNFIVYVLSVDLSRRGVNGKELILRAYSYREIANGETPHYRKST